ncbi:hypothetical protein P7B04_12130 [Sphingobium yanoikuyae]|jgi:hypothetical protein|nr:hypothetical protein [Sphingobium yanoikuyae]
MRLMTHVRRTSDGGFEVRIIVPEKLRSAIGKSSLTKRLGRLSKSEANRLAAPIIDEFRTRIERARLGGLDAMPPPPLAFVGAIAPVSSSLRRASPSKLMELFDGYVRER